MSTEAGVAVFNPDESLDRRYIALVAVLAVTAATGGLWIAAATPSTDIPVGIASAEGVSMSPTFGAGDNGIAFYAPGELQPGDVVIFYEAKNTQSYTMHRVVEETDRGFVTKGDAFSVTDQSMGRSYVTPETRVGKVYVVVDSKGVHFPAW